MIISPQEFRSMENLNRKTKMEEFIKHNLQADSVEISPLTTDASSRKYYRVKSSDKSFVVMDDEGCRCHTFEFVELSKFLRARNVWVPEVLATDFKNGFLLIEDLGDDTVGKLLTPQNEAQLYEMSGDAVAKVAAVSERPQCVKEFSRDKILEDLRLFTDWYFPMTTGQPLNPQAAKEFFEIAEKLVPMAYRVPNRLVLWDYHIDNIMLPPRAKECAIIDFQDAMWGPLTYDIMSLLAADRRFAPKEVIEKVKERFFESLSNVRREDFDDSYAFLSMFRHLRVLGRFTTLSMVNGKKRYLEYIPQVWTMLEQVLKYPKLAPMKNWLDNNLPQPQRGLPQRKPFNQAMILAAGRGTRMQNLTDDCPKPLIKVGDKALIDYNFDRLREIGIKNAVVNLCYKKEMLKQHLEQSQNDFNLVFSEEEEALETGGGVKQALPLLKDECFFVFNSDVFFIDKGYKPALWRMMDAWDKNKYDILLLLQDLKDICGDKGIGDYKIGLNGKIERNYDKKSGYPYMFAGISIVNRKIFAQEERKKFSLRDLFDLAEKEGKLGFIINQSEFFHVGTPEALEAAETKIRQQMKKIC